MRWLLVPVLASVMACGGGGGPVRLEEATVCSPPTLQLLLLSGDRHEALHVSVGRDQFETIDGPTEFELADLNAVLLKGANLDGAACSDLPGNVQVDESVPVDEGTLSIAISAGRTEISLRNAASESYTIEDVEFTNEFVAASPG